MKTSHTFFIIQKTHSVFFRLRVLFYANYHINKKVILQKVSNFWFSHISQKSLFDWCDGATTYYHRNETLTNRFVAPFSLLRVDTGLASSSSSSCSSSSSLCESEPDVLSTSSSSSSASWGSSFRVFLAFRLAASTNISSNISQIF